MFLGASIAWNSGDGAWFAQSVYTNPHQLGNATAAVGDLDSDNRHDFLLCQQVQDPFTVLRVFYNNGGRAFAEVAYPLYGRFGQLAAADIDNDGAPDILLTNHGLASIALMRNLGGRNFGPPQYFPVGFGYSLLLMRAQYS